MAVTRHRRQGLSTSGEENKCVISFYGDRYSLFCSKPTKLLTTGYVMGIRATLSCRTITRLTCATTAASVLTLFAPPQLRLSLTTTKLVVLGPTKHITHLEQSIRCIRLLSRLLRMCMVVYGLHTQASVATSLRENMYFQSFQAATRFLGKHLSARISFSQRNTTKHNAS